MMTVAEEVERALQIASASQKVAYRDSSASSAQEIINRATNSVASKAAAPSNKTPSSISSSDAVTVRRSPDFSTGLQNCSNSGEKANGSCFENGRIIGGIVLVLLY